MKKELLALAWCAAVVGFSLAFALPAYVKMPLLWYYPLDHRWAFEVTPSGLAMDW